jgi:site-specific DNA recombinase
MTPTDGVVTDLTDGIRAVFDSQYLDDLKHAVRRGCPAEFVRDFPAVGSLTAIAWLRSSTTRVSPSKAFGKLTMKRQPSCFGSSRNISLAARPAPSRMTSTAMAYRGHVRWNASTINGNHRRGNGVINNELYRGQLIWNKVRMVKDPDTGRCVSRPNPESEWHTASVPDLAIVTDEMFQEAQRRKAAHAHQLPTHQRRPRHVLSGLLRCAACGSGMSSYGGRNGQTRIRCPAANESGTCPDPLTFELSAVESAVLSGLRKELQHPDLIAEYVRTYQAERQRLAMAASRNGTRLERRRGEIDREVARLVDGIAKGIGDPKPLGDRMKVICAERRDIEAQLEAADAKPLPVAPYTLPRSPVTSSGWVDCKRP